MGDIKMQRLPNGQEHIHLIGNREEINDHAAALLRADGALVVLPGASSPLAELVMAAIEAAQAPRLPAPTKEMAWLLSAADDVAADLGVKVWIERGRE